MTTPHFRRTLPHLLLAALLLAPLGLGAASAKSAAGAAQPLVFVGTYTGPKSKGIYAYRMDTATGALAPLGLAAETVNPTFLAVHPNQRFLYAANEISSFDGKKNNGAVSAFAIDAATGRLRLINQESSGGGGPCHLVVDKTGWNVLVANYGGGSVAALPVKADGRLGQSRAFIQHAGTSVNPQRQGAPHAHHIVPDPANRRVLACDLGLDKIVVYRFDAGRGTLTTNDPPAGGTHAGAGPRHLAFHPGGKFAYVINELDCTMTAFEYVVKKGTLTEFQTLSTLPPGEDKKTGHSTAEVEMHPGGKFLYGSNRGHDTIVVYAVDQRTGQLTHVENVPSGGKTPRSFGIDPSGSFLLAANQSTDNIAVFRIHPQTGRLTDTGHRAEGVGAPVCVKFVPAK